MQTPDHHLYQQAIDAVESTVRHLANQNGMAVASCSWNRGKGVSQATHHRLDVYANYKTFKIYFTDHELLDYPSRQAVFGTDQRLEHLICELQSDPWALPYMWPLKRLASQVRP